MKNLMNKLHDKWFISTKNRIEIIETFIYWFYENFVFERADTDFLGPEAYKFGSPHVLQLLF